MLFFPYDFAAFQSWGGFEDDGVVLCLYFKDCAFFDAEF